MTMNYKFRKKEIGYDWEKNRQDFMMSTEVVTSQLSYWSVRPYVVQKEQKWY